jgi:RNA polymerase sigma factor (sigma-70 family)
MTDSLPGTDPVPLGPPSQPIEGGSHAHLIPRLISLAGELGYSVELRALPEHGPGGWCDQTTKQIVVAAGPANREVRTLVHELAHAIGLGYAQYGRQRAEVLVDCVTYIVCSSAGLDVGGESIAYIAGWGEDGALDAIREYATTIDAVARRIEDALDPEPDRTPPAADATVNFRSRSDVAFGRAARPALSGKALADLARSGRMQPDNERRPAGRATALRGDEADLYRRHSRALQRAVARMGDVSPQILEDACQFAWSRLLLHQPNRRSVFAWLYVVARHEVYRLSAIERGDAPLEDLPGDQACEAPMAGRPSLDDRLEANEALRALADLPEPQRRDLTLLVAGFSYREIAEMTGGRTYSNVNKHLKKARARMRLARSGTRDGATFRRRPSS